IDGDEHVERGEHDDRHQAEAEPEFFADLHSGLPFSAGGAASPRLSSTWTIALSFSTSTSSTSCSREGHAPSLMQMTQRAISTKPCSSRMAPAKGMKNLKGY